ncbi:FeoA family protein [Streptomyces sp. NPDC006997]|uniref:FeoA family protein n=1 Tax=Streptomyces sp. NPDC006997 TaxID=3155356 RepID=UPI0033EA286F
MSSVDQGGEEAGARVAAGVRRESLALADLAPGARAAVAEVVGGETPAVARRLADLGFVPGAVVEVVRRAPLRDPVVYRVQDYEVCLRRAQSACVYVVEVER